LRRIKWRVFYEMKVKWGQNFLVNERVALRIISYLDLNPEDKILEIGGGKGILTEFLKEAKEVLVVEIDKKLANTLTERFRNFKNIRIINCDFLKPNRVLKEIFNEGKGYKVVGNIPYNITSPILDILTIYDFFNQAILTVQKEVGERIFAKSGTKKFGRLTLQIRTFFDVKKLFYIKKGSFFPVPEVDSVTILLKKKRKYFKGEKKELWEKFLRTVFSKKRKIIKNSLYSLCKDKTEFVLKKAEIPFTLRPEQINIDEYMRIFDIIEKS